MGHQSNNLILLKASVEQELEDNTEYEDISSFFEFFAASQYLKDYELSDEDVQSGIKGASLDGGCDAIYIFYNNMLMNEDIASTLVPQKDASLVMFILQMKYTPSFKEDAIMKWKTVSGNLLDYDNEINSFTGRYNSDVLSAFELFKSLQIKLVRSHPKVSINYRYITLAAEVHPNVVNQADELKNDIKKLFPNPSTVVDVDFIGADRLMEMISTSPTNQYLIHLLESPIALGQQQNYIALIGLDEYFKFIADENKQMRNNIFEANVRDYQGRNAVNTGISQSLNNQTGENFWWLNNGITMLASEAHQPTGKEIVVTDPEIVNGLQTSNEIYNYFLNNEDALSTETRSVLVRIIVPDSESSRDRIILATNNQTNIPKSSLRVTDPIHWQIEMYLKNKGLFYDRRKNYYKNNGKKSHQIISVSFLAQCLITLLLQQPEQARARPSTLLTDDTAYATLYENDHALDVYLHSAQLGKKVQQQVKKIAELSTTEKSDILFYVLYASVAQYVGSHSISSADIANINVEHITVDKITTATTLVIDTYKELGGNSRVAKDSLFVCKLQEKLFT